MKCMVFAKSFKNPGADVEEAAVEFNVPAATGSLIQGKVSRLCSDSRTDSCSQKSCLSPGGICHGAFARRCGDMHPLAEEI